MNSPFFKINKQGKNTRARLGELVTPHGVIQTPVFMPVFVSPEKVNEGAPADPPVSGDV